MEVFQEMGHQKPGLSLENGNISEDILLNVLLSALRTAYFYDPVPQMNLQMQATMAATTMTCKHTHKKGLFSMSHLFHLAKRRVY